jgi:CelD/BcsL family acetyltransferase involved in cellulose biosynthesis
MKGGFERGDATLLEQYANEWTRLCQEGPDDEPFFHPEWILTYLRAFEPEAKVVLATARHEDRLRAVLPLVQQSTLFCGFPVKMLRGAANEHSCRFDLVCPVGAERELATQALWDVLKEEGHWDLIELPYVPEGGAAEHLLRAAKQDGYLTGRYDSYTSPYVHLPDGSTVDDLPASSHFTANLHRRRRRAMRIWDVRLRKIETADPEELNRFLELEASGWKGKERTAIACHDSTRLFYQEIARVASQAGYFTLYLLEFEGVPVAGHFGLSYRGRYYSPKVAYDEEFSEFGPGHLIVDAILRDVQTRGFREFDFLGPSMDWKSEWTKYGRPHAFCYIFRPGVFGQTLSAAKLKLSATLRRIAPLRKLVGAIS